MHTGSVPRVIVLLAAGLLASGCGASSGHGGSPMHPLQLRLVTSSHVGTCSAPPLTTDGPGSACDRDGTTTYVLGESLGAVTPASVTSKDGGVEFEMDGAGSGVMREVTTSAVDRQLAILLDGTVLSAAVVKQPVTTGRVALPLATPAEADAVAAELRGTATP
jgi:preprotein translocase subunit SecD